MACKFCGVGDQNAINHGTSSECVAALHGEITRLRKKPEHTRDPFVPLHVQSERFQPDQPAAVPPKLNLQY
jgi:hypothetical protein